MIKNKHQDINGGRQMTIGIIGAMDEEIALFKQTITNKQEIEIANTLFIEGEFEGKKVVLLKSGIGKVNAALATTIMHERFSPQTVINTGSAGGFAPELTVGDLVISTEVVHHDVNVTAFNYEYGQVPNMPPVFTADSTLLEKTKQAAKKLNINYETGLIATGDSFMAAEEDVKKARNNFPKMIAAEMEAAAVAQVCYQYEKPFIIIRALSDIAGKESSVSFNEFIDIAAKHATELVIETVKSL